MIALLLAASAYGTGFSLPVPDNFHEEDAQTSTVKREGGVLLQQQIPPPLPEVFTADIIVTAVRPGDLNSARPAVCEKLANHWLKDGATLQKAGVVALPFGPVCQISLHAPKKGKHAISRVSIIAAKGKYSTVTCNYDERDQAAKEACDKALAGFQVD